MLSKLKEVYGIFGMAPSYTVDKGALKKKYYELSKQTHPDRARYGNDGDSASDKKTQMVYGTEKTSSSVNEAYKILSDDFLRAKLFATPSDTIDQGFLTECLELEERIRDGEDIKEELNSRIEQCKRHFQSPEWLSKWAYYKRLLDMARELGH